MSRSLFDYLSILAVIQPARVQDIERYATEILPGDYVEAAVREGIYRSAHEEARLTKLVTSIKRGTYFLTPAGREVVRRNDLHKEIDNIRLFLMKTQRRRYR